MIQIRWVSCSKCKGSCTQSYSRRIVIKMSKNLHSWREDAHEFSAAVGGLRDLKKVPIKREHDVLLIISTNS